MKINLQEAWQKWESYKKSINTHIIWVRLDYDAGVFRYLTEEISSKSKFPVQYSYRFEELDEVKE